MYYMLYNKIGNTQIQGKHFCTEQLLENVFSQIDFYEIKITFLFPNFYFTVPSSLFFVVIAATCMAL